MKKPVPKKKPAKMSPRDARTSNQLCRLQSDNIDISNFWLLCGPDYVALAQQKAGEKPTQAFSIPKKHFNRLVEWYLREQKLVADRY